MKTLEITPREYVQQVVEPKEFDANIIDYYDDAGPDYAAWSKEYNMHFGYYKWGMNPFNREKMLNAMTEQVYDALQLNTTAKNSIADFGCGVGASLRHIAKKYTKSYLYGITIVLTQILKGNRLTKKQNLDNRVFLWQFDYTNTPFTSNSLDGAVAIESACHAKGKDKAQLIKEMYRVLKPGSRVAIADCFVKQEHMRSGLRKIYNKACKGWAVEEFANLQPFVNGMKRIGFKNIDVREISYRIAPSVMHIPWVSIKFLFKQLFEKNNPMNKHRWNNVISPLLSIILGMHRKTIGYYLISAEK